MSNIYTSPARVVRDGRLVAFKGERMSMDEAAYRGLLDQVPVEEPMDEPDGTADDTGTDDAPDGSEPVGSADGGEPDGSTDDAVNLEELTNKELAAMCAECGIEVPKKATKPQLLELLGA